MHDHDCHPASANVSPASSQPGETTAAYLSRVLSEVCFGSEAGFPLDATLDRYFSPDFRQCVDGVSLSRAEFAQHIRLLRQRLRSGRIEVIEALRDGRRIADRHTVHAWRHDGGEVRAEVLLFGELAADGRICRVDEVTRLLAGAPGDADLGRAH